MKIYWDYKDFTDSITIPIHSKIRGLRREGKRPNKVVIGFQEYKEVIKELGEEAFNTQLYSYIIPSLNPRSRTVLIEVLNDRLF